MATSFRLLGTILLLVQSCSCTAAPGCGVEPAVLKVVWDNYANLPPRLRASGGRESGACLAAVRADFNSDQRDDVALVVSPNGRDMYLYGAFNLPSGWHVGLIEVYRDFEGTPMLQVASPGHYETYAPGNRELEPGERLEFDTQRPGVVLVSKSAGVPRRAFFLGTELWVQVRLPPS
jgi:hypothetical protein